MKKIITSGILLFSALIGFSVNTTAQTVQKGNFIIDPYYGGPNFGKKLVSGLSTNEYSTSNYKGLGPLGLRAEYMLADKFGIGVDFIYNSVSTDLKFDSLNTDGSLYKTYNGTGAMRRIRVQLRFNYHFVTTEVLDAYVGVGAGSNTRIWSAKSNHPEYAFNNTATGTLIPFSMRVAVGMRYYFIPNLGVHAEIGIGGPVISAGLSVKI